ncbi:MAG: LacI family DNA-binding transcriptional regulator [Bacteroidota bacterium]
MGTNITMKDLAKLLKLSPSTISKALRDNDEISSRTRRRVQETAKAMGYVPNYHASHLKSKITRTIGIVLPNIVEDFFAKVLQGLEKEAVKHGFTVLIAFSDDRKKKEDTGILSLINKSVDGILISFSKETQKFSDYESIKKFIAYGVPIIMLDRVCRELPFDNVTINDFDGAYQATRHLYDSGYKKIAFLSPISNTSVGRSRKNGYIHGLRHGEKDILTPFFIDFANYKNFRTLLSDAVKKYSINGVVAADETSAIHTLTVLQQLGYNVPGEISVIGFTNGPMAQCSNPPLSVVSQHAEKIGARAFQLLRSRLIDNKLKKRNVVIEPELILRGSTKEP